MKRSTIKHFVFSAILCGAASVVIAGLTGCMRYQKPNSDTATSGTMTLVCDNSFQNIMEQEIEVFEYQYPEAHILATGFQITDPICAIRQRDRQRRHRLAERIHQIPLHPQQT